jgi:hypothetical protein
VIRADKIEEEEVKVVKGELAINQDKEKRK